MKWIPISKAKVKFNQLYLIASHHLERPCCGTLKESKITEVGVQHTFLLDVETEKEVQASHICLVNIPEK